MLLRYCPIPLEAAESAIRRAAALHGARVLACRDLGDLLRESGLKSLHEAQVFSLSFPELYAALLSADTRFSAFLPCRIAAYSQGSGTVLETVSPHEFARLIHAVDLERLIHPLETALREILEEVARMPVPPVERRLAKGQMPWRQPVPEEIGTLVR